MVLVENHPFLDNQFVKNYGIKINFACFLFFVQIVFQMDEIIQWHLCILCQKQTDEGLVCPLDNPVASRREGAYAEITHLVSQFRAIGNAPHPDADLPDVESMLRNRASWHTSCRQLYKKSALERADCRTIAYSRIAP